MSISSKIILRSDYVRIDGTKSLFLRLTINRKVKYYPLNLSCLEKYWNKQKSRVSKSCQNSYRINLSIEKSESKSKQIIFDYHINDKTLTFTEFHKLFKNNTYNYNSFLDFISGHIEDQNKKLKKGTIKGYNDQLNKLRDYQSEIMFSELTTVFLDEYKLYLKLVRKNNKNTIVKSITFIKNMLNKAVNDGVLKDNPCKSYKQGRIEGNRERLSMNELKKLQLLFDSGKLKQNKANVLRYFLFCCYTGLRYSDIKSLKYSNINEDIISIIMHKTDEPVMIPLNMYAKNLIPKTKGYFKNQTVFNVLTDQPTNRYLKEIMDIAGVNKSISFHCARHTFATVGIDLGIPIDLISKLLGHTDIKTTMIYAKYNDEVKKREMEKWNKVR